MPAAIRSAVDEALNTALAGQEIGGEGGFACTVRSGDDDTARSFHRVYMWLLIARWAVSRSRSTLIVSSAAGAFRLRSKPKPGAIGELTKGIPMGMIHFSNSRMTAMKGAREIPP